MKRLPKGERGAASVLVVSLCGVLLLLGAGMGVVAAILVDHRRAQSAADLAALAGATAIGDGGEACASAAAVAELNGAALTACAVEGQDVVVDVIVSGPRWLGQTGDLVARARAGPASPGMAQRSPGS